MNGLADLRERLATLEEKVEEVPVLKAKVAALEKFQIMVMTGIAAVGAVLTFFADTVRKKIGWS